MDCTECQELLLDLLSDALPPEQAASVRAELARCDDCRAAHAQLARGMALANQLTIVAPPPDLAARIMAIAELQHGKVSAQALRPEPVAHVQSAPPRVPEESAGTRWLAFIGQFLMGRQVGMATIMLLVAVGSLWILPELNQQREAVGVTAVSPEAENRLPPATSSPAAPAAEIARERAAAPDEPGEETRAELAVRPTDGAAVERKRGIMPKGAPAPEPLARKRMARRAAEKPAPSRSSSTARGASGLRSEGSGLAAGRSADSLLDEAIGSGAAPARKKAKTEAKAQVTYAPPPPPAAAQPTFEKEAAEVESEAAGNDLADRDDRAAREAPAAAPAKAPAGPKQDKQEPADLRTQALQDLSAGQCRSGLTAFDELVRRAGGGRDIPLIEAAIRCFTRSGRKHDADRWQARLSELQEQKAE